MPRDGEVTLAHRRGPNVRLPSPRKGEKGRQATAVWPEDRALLVLKGEGSRPRDAGKVVKARKWILHERKVIHGGRVIK